MFANLSPKKKVIYFAIGFVIVASLIFSESLRKMISRRQDIASANRELQDVSAQVEEMRDRLSRLKSHPNQYERLVRNDLGYIRPGEKEVRFSKDQ